MKLDHLGIAVRSLDAAVRFYESVLGLRVSGFYDVPQEKVRVAMLPLGATRIELLEATAKDSPIARFIAKRGEGLHHIAIKVDDVSTHVRQLRAAGVRLVGDGEQVGAGGHRYTFIHPSSAGGVLVELVEAAREKAKS